MRFPFLLLMLASLCSANLPGQQPPVKKIEKPVQGTPSLDFDRETQLNITLNTKDEPTFISYMRLKKNRSVTETITQEIKKDNRIRKKFPYDYNSFVTAGTFNRNLPALPKYATSRFHEIPPENISYSEDTKMLQVNFTSHNYYDRDKAIKEYTYIHKTSSRKKVRWDYVEKQYDYLKPNSRYALILGFSLAETIAPIFQDIHSGNLLKAQNAVGEIRKEQREKSNGLSFIPDFADWLTFYNTELLSLYQKIDQKTASVLARNGTGTTSVLVGSLSGNITLQKLLDEFKSEELRNLSTTGPTRDSLMQLMNTVSNLYNGNTNLYYKFLAGALPIDFQPISTEASKIADKNSNLVKSIDKLVRLEIYVNNYRLLMYNRILSTDQTALDNLIGYISNLKTLMNENAEDLGEITKTTKKNK